MKQCPSCKTTYTDDSLSFCLADGTPLAEMAEQVTVVRSGDPLRVEIPQSSPPSYAGPPPTQETGPTTSKIVLVVGLLAAMILVAVAGAAALIYFNKDSRTEPNSNKAQTSPSQTPKTDNTNQLRDQIANLEKRLDEQKNAKTPGPTPSVNSNSTTGSATATVNSPGDGFLALRTLPSSESGERIAKIPHGAAVSIGECGPVVRPVSRSGRWCRASYRGQSGYVFDAYLNY